MALNIFDCKGYGQIEPNQVWFTRAGMSESQCAFDPKEIASHFPMTAEEAGKKFNIKLIDGETLTKLMIEYKVGVQVQDTFELLEIDDDFFKKEN